MNTFKIPLIIAEAVFCFGLLGLIAKLRLPARATVVLKKTFFCLCVVLVILIVLALFDIYLRGYWTTKFLIWLFMITASFLFTFGNRKVLTEPLRTFTGFIFFFPSASLVTFLIVPFFGPLLAFGIWLHILGDPKAIVYNDPEMRIQNVSSTGQFKGWPRLFVKKGIVEFDRGEMSVNYYFDPDSIKVEKSKDEIIVYLYKTGFSPVPFKFKR